MLKDIKWETLIATLTTLCTLGFIFNSILSGQNQKILHQNQKEIEMAKIEMEKERIKMEMENNKLNVRLNIDKLTYCMQTIMESSVKSGKPIDAHKAKEICQSADL